MEESLRDIIGQLWTTHERSEWIPRTDVLALSDIHRWMANKGIEVLGFIHAMLHDRRFRIEPPIFQPTTLNLPSIISRDACKRILTANGLIPDTLQAAIWLIFLRVSGKTPRFLALF